MATQFKKEGGIIDRISKAISSLFEEEHFPKRFRNALKEFGDEPITSISMYRAPVDRIGEMAVQLITAGKWNDIKNKAGVDKVFHTGMVINNKYTLEKLSKLELRKDTSTLNKKDTETFDIPVNKEITINELVSNAYKKMRDKFFKYDFLNNNCQSFVQGVLSASGLLSSSANQWIKQDISKIIEEMPSLSKYLGKKLTDVARGAENVQEELFYRKGGVLRRRRRF